MQSHRKNSKKRMSARWMAVLIGLCLLLGIAGGAALAILPGDQHIARGVRIAGVELGGMTQPEARRAIEQALAHQDEQITLRAGTGEQTVTLADLGIAPDADTLAKQAYQVGRQGSLFTIASRNSSARISMASPCHRPTLSILRVQYTCCNIWPTA